MYLRFQENKTNIKFYLWYFKKIGSTVYIYYKVYISSIINKYIILVVNLDFNNINK